MESTPICSKFPLFLAAFTIEFFFEFPPNSSCAAAAVIGMQSGVQPSLWRIYKLTRQNSAIYRKALRVINCGDLIEIRSLESVSHFHLLSKVKALYSWWCRSIQTSAISVLHWQYFSSDGLLLQNASKKFSNGEPNASKKFSDGRPKRSPR